MITEQTALTHTHLIISDTTENRRKNILTFTSERDFIPIELR